MLNYHNETEPKIGAEKNRCYYIPKGKGNSFTQLRDWKFGYFEDFDEAAALAAKPKTDIKVPSCMEMLGYGAQQYTNIRYPFPYTPPKVLGKNPCGVYVTEYEKSASEKQYIVFEGVDSAYYLFVNGKFVGYATIPHNTTEFDISPYLTQKKNEIRVIVLKHNSASYLEDQDKFRMSGIFRKVYILGRPADHVCDYKVTASADGKLEITADRDAEYELYDGDNLMVSLRGKNVKADISATAHKESGTNTKGFRPWTDETPNLYRLVIKYNGEEIEEQVGFRTVEIKGNVFLLNGKPVKLRGVNRHSFTRAGYAETEEDFIRDITLFKKNNINAVRTSHYPPAPEFLKLCDRYGIIVLEEADIESHGCVVACGTMHDVAKNPVFEKQFEERILGMYERDKNRSSVLIWSLGNESGWGENFVKAAKKLKKLDDRPLHYENEYDWKDGEKVFYAGDCLDTVSEMYPYPEHCEKLLKSEYCKNKPYVMCEYTHAMGNSSGDAKDYWDLIRANDNFMGAFVWEWCDEVIACGKGDLYGGDFGEEMHDGNFCVDGLVTVDRKEKSSLHEIKKIYSPFVLSYDGKNVSVASRFFYRTFSGVLNIALRENGKTKYTNRIPFTVKAGERVEIPYKAEKASGFTTLVCEILSAEKEELLKEDFVYDRQGFVLSDEKIAPNPKKEITFTLGADGNIASLISGGKEILSCGFEVDIFRAYLDNERSVSGTMSENGLPRAYNFPSQRKGNVIKGIVGAQAAKPLLEYALEYKAENNALRIKFDYEYKCDKFYLPRVGLSFAVKGAQNVTFLGNGRGESYKDKQNYAVKDFYAYNSADEECPYLMPQEYGSHNGTEFVKLEDCGLCIAADKEFSFSALPYSAKELCAKKHDFELNKDGNTYIHIDADHSGVGSASCGPVLSEKYHADKKGSIEFVLWIE